MLSHSLDHNIKSPIRVLHIASGDLWAGAEVQVRNIVAAQRRFDDVVVHAAVLNDGRLAQELSELGVATEILNEKKVHALALLWRLRNLVREWRIDIIHTHRQKENILGSTVTLLSPSARSLRTVHGAPENLVAKYDFRRRTIRWLDRLVARRLQVVSVAVSEDLAAQLVAWLSSEQIRVIENALGDEVFELARQNTNTPPAKESKVIRIAFFGRLVPVKRTDLLIEIAAIVNTQCPGYFSFHIYGDGPLRASLKQSIAERNLSDSVVLEGFTNSPVDTMSRYDLLLITSDHEGLPTAVLEAMLARLPVMARAVGGIPSALGNGAYGTLVDSSRPADFVRQLREYERCASAFHERARIARKVVLKYSSSNMAEKYNALYREILGDRTVG